MAGSGPDRADDGKTPARCRAVGVEEGKNRKLQLPAAAEPLLSETGHKPH